MTSFLLDAFLLAACAPTEAQTVKQAAQRTLQLTDSDTLAKIAGELSKEARALCIPDRDGKSWLDRFTGTPLFDQAVALQQQMLQLDTVHRQKEQQVEDLRKQLGVNWEDRRAEEDRLDLQRQMLDLQLAQYNNAQLTQPEPVPEATLGQVAAKVASESKVANTMDLLKRMGSPGVAALGAGLGAVAGGTYGAATAAPGESALSAAAKAGLAGAALGGLAGAGAGHALAKRSPAAVAAPVAVQAPVQAPHPAMQAPGAGQAAGAAAPQLRPALDRTVTDAASPRLTQAGAPLPAALSPAAAPAQPPSHNTIQASPLSRTNSPLASSVPEMHSIPGVASGKIAPDNAYAILSRLGWQPGQPLPALLQ